MRPTPDEVIAGVRTLLKQEIAPGLAPHAQSQLKRVIATLRDGRWNDAAFYLLRENTAFADQARRCSVALEQEADIPSEFGTLPTDLRTAADFSPPASFAEANAINRALRTALSRFIEFARGRQNPAIDGMCRSIGAALIALRI